MSNLNRTPTVTVTYGNDQWVFDVGSRMDIGCIRNMIKVLNEQLPIEAEVSTDAKEFLVGENLE